MDKKIFARLDSPAGPTISLVKIEFSPTLPSTAARGVENGLSVGIASGIHGDELNGTYICALLIQFLKKILFEKKVAELSAKIKILPALNPAGLNNSVRFWPFDQTDINRMFPGYDKGETSQRLAGAIFNELADLTYLLDIHSSNIFVRETPQVRLYEPDDETLRLGYEFALPILWVREITAPEKVQLPQTLSANGTKSFVIQAGNALAIDAKLCKNITFGIFQWLIALKALRLNTGFQMSDLRKIIVGDSPYSYEKTGVVLANHSNTLSLTSESAGFFVLVEENLNPLALGRKISKGEELGIVFDPASGEIKQRICSPVDGTLFTVRNHPVVYQGSLLARLVSEKKLPADLSKSSQPEQPQ